MSGNKVESIESQAVCGAVRVEHTERKSFYSFLTSGAAAAAASIAALAAAAASALATAGAARASSSTSLSRSKADESQQFDSGAR